MRVRSQSDGVSRTEHALRILDQVEAQLAPLVGLLQRTAGGFVPITSAFDQISEDLADGRRRRVEEVIRIGIMGGRGSGKSTLANALLGSRLLPHSAMMFCTGIPTAIRYSASPSLDIESGILEHEYHKRDIPLSELQSVLASVARESENRSNSKQVTSIRVGFPEKWLVGKELVDVPGFTKGNPLHQSFAEKYAKHYCDVCFVLINNAESIEVGPHQGWEALAKIFSDRTDTTVFIINKCDQADDADIQFMKESFATHFQGRKPEIFEISSLNILNQNGDLFRYHDFLHYVTSLSTRQSLILVQAILGRLLANFTSLRELSGLSNDRLDKLSDQIRTITQNDFPRLYKDLVNQLKMRDALSANIPVVDLSEFDLPANTLGLSPYEYATDLVESIKSQIPALDQIVQQQQASIYSAIIAKFERCTREFGLCLRAKLSEFEAHFGVTTSIQEPHLQQVFPRTEFNPSRIERLKPTTLRLWVERILPNSLLGREVQFSSRPINVSLGIIEIGFPVPVALKSRKDVSAKIQREIPAQAVALMNEYIHSSLDAFVRQVAKSYDVAMKSYRQEWLRQLREYANRVEAAKPLGTTTNLKALDSFVSRVGAAYDEVARLQHND